MAKYTPDEIVEVAKRVADQLDHPLTRREFMKLSGINDEQIGRAFPIGRWSEVKRLAGLAPHPMHKT
jgi:hypothetical protein